MLDTKPTGKPSAGKQPAGFDAGAWNPAYGSDIEALSTETESHMLG